MLRHRWLILRWMVAVGILSGVMALLKAPAYQASAGFIPQGQSSGSSLAGLAGQFGVSIPSAAPTQSPEFYQQLLKSRVLLLPIVRDTFTLQEKGGRRAPFIDLFQIEGPTPLHKEERAIRALSQMIGTTISKPTGVVSLSVVSPWRSVSLQLAERLLDGVNEYNQRTRQSVASAERQAIEASVGTARRELTAAEDALESFQSANRQLGGASALARDRLQRTVDLKSAVYTTLAQSYEDARIREIRDTPAIAIFEPAWAPTYPLPRGRVIRVILGLIAGAVIGIAIVFLRTVAAARRQSGDPEFSALLRTVDDLRQDVTRPFRRAARTK
jgi:uncharacterized protein involved in exopolysaccharide biosynthesis